MPSPIPDTPTQAVEVLRNVEDVLPIEQILPTQALILGGAVLIGVVLLHGILMRAAQAHVVSRIPALRRQPVGWRIDLVMISAVLILLGAGLLEVVAWSAALRYARVLPSWPAAAGFAASSFTTLGDAPVGPPPGWRMLGPIIAISGLFTFGWSGSVLVDVVRRLGHMRDLGRLAHRRRSARPVPSATA
jgi:hypothetical protein